MRKTTCSTRLILWVILSSAARLSGLILIRGFASPPRDGFALFGKGVSAFRLRTPMIEQDGYQMAGRARSIRETGHAVCLRRYSLICRRKITEGKETKTVHKI